MKQFRINAELLNGVKLAKGEKHPYKLTDSEKQKHFDLLRSQARKSKYYGDSPAFCYLVDCREFLRMAIFAKENEKTLFERIEK